MAQLHRNLWDSWHYPKQAVTNQTLHLTLLPLRMKFWSLTDDYMVQGCMARLSQSTSLGASLLQSRPWQDRLACRASWAEATSPPAPLQVKKTQRPHSLPSITSIPVTYWQIHNKHIVTKNPFLLCRHTHSSSPLSSCQHLLFLPQNWSWSFWISLAIASYSPPLKTPHTTGCTPTHAHTYTSYQFQILPKQLRLQLPDKKIRPHRLKESSA